MSEASPASSRRGFRWAWVRHTVQVLALALFAAPVLAAGWSLLGLSVGGEEPAATPAQLPFFGSLSSSSVAGVNVLDPFGMLQVAAASKTFEVDWLLAALPVLIVYGLIRGRAFCGWICPVNLLMEIVDAVRRKLRIEVREMPVPRHAKLWIALAVLALSALTSVPVFEAFSPISAINKGILFGAVTGLWVLAAIVAVELFWGHRVWCRSLCPLGGFYEALGRVGQVNVKLDRDACIHCDACKRSCLSDPAILDPVLTERDVIVRAGDCMACGSCIDACPTRALSFTLGRVGK
ncbi:4Fe-4S binding protein [Eggerthella sinensis]|uniref:4Fe-4S binding protein n=1 Tax=Eggerthella sinensis TaxID=242230 RepID=UPI001D0987A1|nr:4Fe-4S binding protein [Eggerthella sinensis]MCB7038850.1 4Fe-4S binding protein [Eggerthella sinensis]